MKSTLSILFLCLIAINCATFTDFNPEVKEVTFKNNGNASKTLLINVKQKVTINGSPREMNAKSEENARERFAKICKESFLFKEVKTGLDTGDIKLTIESENTGEANQFLAFLSGLSLLIIPAYAQDDIQIKYSFRDKKDTVIKEYKRRVTFNTWIHLFMIPLMPFKFPVAEIGSAMEAVTKSVLDEADRDGILK